MKKTITHAGPVWRKGKKVLLCPVAKEDLLDFQHWINDPTNNVFLLRTKPTTMPEQEAWFERASRNDPNNIAVSLRTYDGTLIGNMSLTIDPEKQTATTGSLIGHPDYKGQGYGTDAKMLLLEYAFHWRNVRRALSPIIAFNGRSQAYARKCGYRLMATVEGEFFRNGRWQNEVLYVVFREEWEPLWEQYKVDLPYFEEMKKLLEDDES